MVVEHKPRVRQTPSPAPKQTPAPVAPKATRRRNQSQNWQQRRQELLRRDRAMGAVFGVVCLAGTLLMLYVAGQASATGEGYQLADLNRQLRDEDAEHVRLLREIRNREDSSAIAKIVAEKNLVRTSQGIHYFPERH